MGDSASHRPFRRHSTSPGDRRAFADPSETAHIPVGGHHNENTELPPTPDMAHRHGLPHGATVLLRQRRTDVLPVVVRTWSEWRVLLAVGVLRPRAPRLLEAHADGGMVLEYVRGTPLRETYPDGTPVAGAVVRQLARLLARTCLVERTALPPLPLEYPRGRSDSRGFLRALVTSHHRRIVCANWGVYGGLFEALGVPPQALADWGERLPELTPRPFSLLHGDLHRDNVIVPPGGAPLVMIDWELATYGDPLHDLAIHLVRMRYPVDQWEEVVGAWIGAMLRMRREAVAGVTNDLWYYLEFERAQSLFPDVLRTVRRLNAPFGQAELDRAAEDVTRALRVAAEPLRLPRVPDEARVGRVLEQWTGTGGGRVRVSRAPGRDTRPHLPLPRLAGDGSA
ncbi:phosphotransferase family protein [Streptomyces sp. NPDC000134]|uniref:phosphotransferase family protein n=1 Tax=Streptomyces sp. NPDC000134 TaxID=3364536 RepID=UPI0036BEC40C